MSCPTEFDFHWFAFNKCHIEFCQKFTVSNTINHYSVADRTEVTHEEVIKLNDSFVGTESKILHHSVGVLGLLICIPQFSPLTKLHEYFKEITEGRTILSNLTYNFFARFSIVGYNGIKVGERKKRFSFRRHKQ